MGTQISVLITGGGFSVCMYILACTRNGALKWAHSLMRTTVFFVACALRYVTTLCSVEEGMLLTRRGDANVGDPASDGDRERFKKPSMC